MSNDGQIVLEEEIDENYEPTDQGKFAVHTQDVEQLCSI